jgi:hypothetical protein
MLSKAKRLRIFLERMGAAPAAGSAEEALTLLTGVLNAVEDEFSDVPYNLQLWKTDGRLHPPQEDNTLRQPSFKARSR